MKLIDFNSVHDELNETLMDYGRAQEETAKLFKHQLVAKFERDKFEAKTWLIVKEDLSNGRPLSNDAVAFEVQDDEEYQELQADYIDKKADYEKALGTLKYMEYRLEVLRTVEATQRVELSHHLKD